MYIYSYINILLNSSIDSVGLCKKKNLDYKYLPFSGNNVSLNFSPIIHIFIR